MKRRLRDVADCADLSQDSYTTRHGVLDYVAVEVSKNSGQSPFLRKFAEAWIAADAENKGILRPAWEALIAKYGLEDVLGDG